MTSVHCATCGSKVPRSARFCQACGAATIQGLLGESARPKRGVRLSPPAGATPRAPGRHRGGPDPMEAR
ncbi:MAG: zinc-ribbon domain-containing protein [Actinomycetota bacterium]